MNVIQWGVDIALMLGSILFQLVAIRTISDFTQRIAYDGPPLYDIFHNLAVIPDTRGAKLLKRSKEFFTLIPFAILLLVDSLAFWRQLRYVILINGLRPLFFMTTILPRCQKRKVIVSLVDCLTGGNSDLIFSGHCMYLFASSTMLEKLGIHPFVGFWYIYSALICLLIVTLKEHYSVDIIVSLAIFQATQ